MSGYHLFVGLAVAVLFAVQHMVECRLTGASRAVMGYVISVGLFAAVAEFATLALGRRLEKLSGESSDEGDRVPVAGIFAIASLLLLLNLFSKTLSDQLAIQRRPPPTIPLFVLVGWWLAVLWRVHRQGYSPRTCLVALAGLVLGTRVLVLWVSPFNRLAGDMLATIDRSLDNLLAGHFPYVNFPPPMPYLPGILLAYVPSKLLGCDLRITNLVLDVVSVAAATISAPDAADRPRPRVSPVGPIAAPTPGQWALPFFMLHPTWTYCSVNTQFSPCLLAAVLLGRAVTTGSPRVQAMALGLAVGSNQMLGACGPILFSHWLGRYGLRRALGLALLSMAVFMALIAPFLIWNPKQFIDVAFLSRGAHPPEIMWGRFTLLPLISRIVPHASVSLSLLVVLIGATFAMRAHRPQAVVVTLALGLCGVLLLQPVSFSHYFLPVIALAAIAPAPPPQSPSRALGSADQFGKALPEFRGPNHSKSPINLKN